MVGNFEDRHDRVTCSGQRNVSGRNVCHFWAEALRTSAKDSLSILCLVWMVVARVKREPPSA